MRPANKIPNVSLFLQTKQPCSSISADFQLWLAHQQDPQKNIHKGTRTGSGQADVLLFQQAFESCRQ